MAPADVDREPCPTCGTLLAKEASFCHGCGRAIGGSYLTQEGLSASAMLEQMVHQEEEEQWGDDWDALDHGDLYGGMDLSQMAEDHDEAADGSQAASPAAAGQVAPGTPPTPVPGPPRSALDEAPRFGQDDRGARTKPRVTSTPQPPPQEPAVPPPPAPVAHTPAPVAHTPPPAPVAHTPPPAPVAHTPPPAPVGRTPPPAPVAQAPPGPAQPAAPAPPAENQSYDQSYQKRYDQGYQHEQAGDGSYQEGYDQSYEGYDQSYQADGSYQQDGSYQADGSYQQDGSYQADGSYHQDGSYQADGSYQQDGSYQEGYDQGYDQSQWDQGGSTGDIPLPAAVASKTPVGQMDTGSEPKVFIAEEYGVEDLGPEQKQAVEKEVDRTLREWGLTPKLIDISVEDRLYIGVGYVGAVEEGVDLDREIEGMISTFLEDYHNFRVEVTCISKNLRSTATPSQGQWMESKGLDRFTKKHESAVRGVVKECLARHNLNFRLIEVSPEDQLYISVAYYPAKMDPHWQKRIQEFIESAVVAYLHNEGFQIDLVIIAEGMASEGDRQQIKPRRAGRPRDRDWGIDIPIPEFSRNPYRFHKLLGTGGMSRVYLATRGAERRWYVVKEAHDQFIALEKCERRLRTEAKILAMFHNARHVVQFYEAYVAQNRFYIAMEYIDGISLQKVVNRARGLEERVIWYWLKQLLIATQALHRASVVHRDINPDNIMLRGKELVLIDLGVARQLRNPVEKGTMIRHGFYSAPEQSRKHAIVHVRADLYSIGATVYYMATAHPAPQFMGEEVRADMRRRGASRRLTDLVVWATQPNPDQRFATIEDMLAMFPRRKPPGGGAGGPTRPGARRQTAARDPRRRGGRPY